MQLRRTEGPVVVNVCNYWIRTCLHNRCDAARCTSVLQGCWKSWKVRQDLSRKRRKRLAQIEQRKYYLLFSLMSPSHHSALTSVWPTSLRSRFMSFPSPSEPTGFPLPSQSWWFLGEFYSPWCLFDFCFQPVPCLLLVRHVLRLGAATKPGKDM